MMREASNCFRLGAEQIENSTDWHRANRRNLQFLWQYVRPYRRRLALAVAGSLPLAALGGIIPWVFHQATQRVTEGAAMSILLGWMLLGLFALGCRSGFEMMNHYLLTLLHAQLSNDIRNDLYVSLQCSSLELHTASRSGELASLVSNDAQAAAAGVIELYATCWLNPVRLLCLVGTMLYFNWAMALFAIASIPLISWSVTLAGKRARKAERQYLGRQGQILGWMIESLTNIRQVKAFDLQQSGFDRFRTYGQELLQFRKQAILLKALVSPAAEIINGLALIAMVALAYHQLQQGQTTPGEIVGCLTAAMGLKTPLKGVAASLVELQRSVAAVQRIDWLTAQQQPAAGQLPLSGPIREIAFENVSFSYDGQRDVLRQVSFQARRGERIAIVGPSGAGKTTLLDLLTGFYPCRHGRILVNGMDLASLDAQSLGRQIGIVSQEPLLFDASIEDNIRQGYPQATAEQIDRAIALADCRSILQRLPQGSQTRVGERGSILSGGERKRVALARALVRPISLLILDEATSELDAAAEASILDDIDRLAADLIVFHISHRPTVLNHCDRALLLDKGGLHELTPSTCRKWMQHRKESLTPICQGGSAR
ncbi:MAG: ABC transporter ATP-binding protein [Syntrophotaleaceae bacterium]